MTLRVIDLFCGPGGFSAGFEAAKFEIVAALDYDKDAVATYSANHEIAAVQQDLTDFDYGLLPDADIVIGGPPCTQFSSAKSNKTRNILDGMLLVQSFLRCVYIKRPKYWIMENVPTIQKYLPSKIPLRWIGIDADGDLDIPTKVELVAADYGVPQKRRRYLIGNFKLPMATHFDPNKKDIFTLDNLVPWRTMGDILAIIPDPLAAQSLGKMTDPNYGFSLSVQQLTDHFYDTRFSEVEQRSIYHAKTQHPYMGRLAWPDHTDRPARTVVATQLGRETLVLATSTGEFRRATVRECASFQSFPITYQFHGRSFNSKYRQAGDAVPPMLSFALAKAIAVSEGTSVKAPCMKVTVGSPANVISSENLRAKRQPNFKRKACFLLPSKEVRGTRCELLVDHFSTEIVEAFGFTFERPIWQSHLVLGEGSTQTTRYKITTDIHEHIMKILYGDLRVSEGIKATLGAWALEIDKFGNGDEIYASFILQQNDKSPLKLVEISKQLTERHLPSHTYHGVHVDCSHFIDHPKAHRIKARVLAGCMMSHLATAAWQRIADRASLHPLN